MKKALPPHGKLSKESKVCIQECVSEFISFVTSQAVDRCKLEKRKTLNGEDVLWSMFTLGFENYSETLKIYLAKYREYEQQEAEKKPPRKRTRRRLVEEEYDSEDIFSEDISPGDSDAQVLSNELGERQPLNSVMVDPLNFEFNDANFSDINLALGNNPVNNYLISRSDKYSQPPGPDVPRVSSRQDKHDINVPDFDEFIERM